MILLGTITSGLDIEFPCRLECSRKDAKPQSERAKNLIFYFFLRCLAFVCFSLWVVLFPFDICSSPSLLSRSSRISGRGLLVMPCLLWRVSWLRVCFIFSFNNCTKKTYQPRGQDYCFPKLVVLNHVGHILRLRDLTALSHQFWNSSKINLRR